MTWGVALRLGRVSNLPTVWTNVLAATTLAGVTPRPVAVVFLCVAFSLFYVGGMFLNDAFDHEIDARERPERPIPSGEITPEAVFAFGAGFLALGVFLTIAIAGLHREGSVFASALAGAALVGTIVLYDARHKQNPLSPLLMALCRVLVYLTVALVVSGHLPGAIVVGAAVVLSYLVGLTYVAKQENLARVGNLWPVVLLLVPFVYGLPAWRVGTIGSIVSTAFLVCVGYALALLSRPAPGRIARAVMTLIAGISLLDALLMAAHGSSGLALVGVAGFALTLGMQRWIIGT